MIAVGIVASVIAVWCIYLGAWLVDTAIRMREEFDIEEGDEL